MLNGIRVLSFTHYLQGPCAAQYLADLGAEVLKIEPVSGAFERHISHSDFFLGENSMFFLLANRNQDSLAVDLKSLEGKEIVLKLAKDADVIIENYRPGVMERLGLGYDAIRRVNPGIVYCSMSGYGDKGAYAQRRGQDVLIQGFSGLASYLGPRPHTVGLHILDQHGAALGAMGILASLLNKKITGKGHKVDTSLIGSSMDIQQEPLAYFLNGADFSDLRNSDFASRIQMAPDGIYETADGYIAVTLIENSVLVKLSDRLSVFSEEDQKKNQTAVDDVFRNVMKEKTTFEWKNIFEFYDVWYEVVNDYDALFRNPEIAENISLLDFIENGEKIRVVGHPNKYDGNFRSIQKASPSLGNAGIRILRMLGYADDEIRELEERGIIFVSTGGL